MYIVSTLFDCWTTNWSTHTQLDVATAELDIYRDKFTSGERQLEEAQSSLGETKDNVKDKQK